MVPKAVVAGSNVLGSIKRRQESMNRESSKVPWGSRAKGVSLCGTNGPMPTIWG